MASIYIAENRKTIGLEEKRPSLSSGAVTPGSTSNLNVRPPRGSHRRARSESPSRSMKTSPTLEEGEQAEDQSPSPNANVQSGRGSSVWSFEGLLKSLGASSSMISNRDSKDQEFRSRFALPESEFILTGNY